MHIIILLSVETYMLCFIDVSSPIEIRCRKLRNMIDETACRVNLWSFPFVRSLIFL